MKPTLLLAEGDAELCDIYRRFLTQRGYEVETASDGLDCLEKLRRLRPTAVVLDRELRWGGGDGILAWLREESTRFVVPVVLTATTSTPAGIAEDIKPPVVTFLSKPFTLTELLESVRAAVANKGRDESFDLHRAAPCSELYLG
jgi:two-component system OmpR family response regulator